MASPALRLGLRVRVRDSLNYSGRTGTLKANSGELDDPWDFNVLLDAVEPPINATRITRKLSEARLIGVSASQVVPI